MGSLLSIDSLQAILATHVDKIGRCIWPVWSRYIENITEPARLTFDTSAEAKILNRFMIASIKKEFAGTSGIHFIENQDFFLGIEGFPSGIDGIIVCRFKKLNGIGDSRNYPTERAKAIRRNDIDDLQGLPPEATVTDIGYVPNDKRTGFTDVQAIRRADGKYIMSFPQTEGGVYEMPLPLLPADGPRFVIEVRKEGHERLE